MRMHSHAYFRSGAHVSVYRSVGDVLRWRRKIRWETEFCLACYTYCFSFLGVMHLSPGLCSAQCHSPDYLVISKCQLLTELWLQTHLEQGFSVWHCAIMKTNSRCTWICPHWRCAHLWECNRKIEPYVFTVRELSLWGHRFIRVQYMFRMNM